MIRCALCRGRIRPPSRPWAAVDGGVHFYSTTAGSMDAYAKWLEKNLSKRVDLVHEDCYDQADPKPVGVVIALNLEARLQTMRRNRS